MSNTTMQGPVFLAASPADPKPVGDCDVCAALHKQWRHATDTHSPAFDRSHATDLAVEMGRHPHPGRERRP